MRLTPSLTEKKKWTPIPPAEMQEALDRAERARKAASSAGAEGGKQKRRNSAAAGTEEGNHGLVKTSVKKNPQGQGKAANNKAGQASSSATPDITSKKAKAAATASKPANAKVQQEDSVDDKVASGVASAVNGVLVGTSNTMEPSQANGPASNNTQHAANSVDQPQTHSMPETVDSGILEERIAASLLLTGDATGAKRKGPAVDRQKGSFGPPAGRQSGSSGAATSNHHSQPRDLARGGAVAGRGGRGHGGKAQRSGNVSSAKYSDNGLSPRGYAKPGFLSPPSGYQGLPYESNMAAAVNAPGFVPYGSQLPHPFYPRGYHYGSASQSESDSGGHDFSSNSQQGGQQPFMPYNMALMPQQHPVTQLPGLDNLQYYILGQIEYYFSIHNLCMDQFLKEQVCKLLLPQGVMLRSD